MRQSAKAMPRKLQVVGAVIEAGTSESATAATDTIAIGAATHICVGNSILGFDLQ